jgi:RNA polymerase sigma-B factor
LVSKRGVSAHAHRVDDTTLIVVGESLTRADCGRLRSLVRDATSAGQAIDIDVSGVRILDAYSISLLAQMHAKAAAKCCVLRVVGASGRIIEQLQRRGVATLLGVTEQPGPSPLRPELPCCGALVRLAWPLGDPIAAMLAEAATLPRGDPHRERLRQSAIEHGLPAAARLARRYSGRGESHDDLSQVAAMGLIKAIDGYDPSNTGGFWAYATPTIAGELRRHFRDKTWGVRVPRRVQDAWLQIRADADILTQRLGRSLTTRDLAAELAMDERIIIEARLAARSYSPASLSAPVLDGSVLADYVAVSDEGFEAVDNRATVRDAMRMLPRRSRRILRLRFRHEMTQTQIAETVGLSQMHVSRIIADALSVLRSVLADDGR